MPPTSQASPSFAVALKHYRTAHELTQDELAARSGVSVRSISDLERGVSRFPHKDTVQLLVDALGLTPDDAERLFALARAPRLPADIGALAEQATPCIGREHELAHLRLRLLDPTLRLLTLTGVGGVGKTRLALECAELARDTFGDEVKLVDLSAVPSARYVAPAIAEALGVREQAAGTLLADVARAIGDRRLLLLLDNCEHVLDARPTLTALLDRCPRLLILATSREKLDLALEEVFVVAPLATPNAQTLANDERLPEYPAIALFVERARTLDDTFALTPVALRTIARICVQLDGIPLAIELAAARTPTLPPRTILAQLTGAPQRGFFGLLRQTVAHTSPRQQSLRDALAWSYHLLDAREQIVFRRASVFAGGWTTEAIEALADPHGILNVDMRATLTALVNKSLIQQDEQPDGSLRYGMRFVMRAYGAALLAERKEEREVYLRLSEYYAGLTETLEQQLTGASQPESLRRLIAEYENIRAVLQWAREQQMVAPGLRISASLWWFWENRGHLTEGREWLEGMLALWARQPQAVDDEIVGRAYYGAAILAIMQGDVQNGATFAEAALARMRSPNKRARVLLTLGNLAKQRGDNKAAWPLYTEAVAILREQGDIKGLVVALNNLSTLAIERGDLPQALTLLEESIALKRELGDQRGIAISLMNQGDVLKSQGQYAQAQAMTQEGLAISESLGDSRGEALAYNNLGEIAEANGDDALAIEHYGRSVVGYRRIEDRPGTAMALHHLGALSLRRSDDQGAANLQEAIALYDELGDAAGANECRRALATVRQP
ncbi:MAG TPA: tetratricopeptide repeat protein [Ktedonobacterales bacterium]|nr:tetratricopeptide repeat protein [Ktedonobacterales bacterium]